MRTMPSTLVLVSSLLLLASSSSAHDASAAPSFLRFTPDPNTAVAASTVDLFIAFDRPIMETFSGSFSVTTSQGQVALNASIRSPNVWVGTPHATHFGATVNLVLPSNTLRVGTRYCVLLSPGAFESSPEGVPGPGLSDGDWCFNVTAKGPVLYKSSIPHDVTQSLKPVITPLLNELHASTAALESTVETLSQFYNRFFASKTGLQSHQWLSQQYQAVAAKYPKQSIRISSFKHRWMMPTLIVRLESAAADASSEVTILGAHLDSINRQNWTQNLKAGRAPGANDDGTGIAVCFEIFKILLEHDMMSLSAGRAIEIHAYSGEEEGLYGSADVAAEYQRQGVRVAAMLMLDQCGYVREPAHAAIGVFTDNTDAAVTQLLVKLIQAYSDELFVMSDENHRADSDFHSFHNNGFRAGYIAEGPVDDIVYGNSKHTAFDLPSGVNSTHAVQIGGVALSFLLELTLEHPQSVVLV